MQPAEGLRIGLDPRLVSLLTTDLSRGTVTVIGGVGILLLMGLSAFFSSSEIAFFSLGNHRIATLVEEGTPGAETVAALKADPRRLLVTILVGNNVTNIGMSSITTGLLGMYFDPGESVLIATFGVTSLVLLFGESAPKSYAVEHAESWALRIAGPLRVVQYLLYPLVALFDRLTRGVNRLVGSEGDFETAYVTRAEIAEMIEAGGREGVFTDEEHRMLQRLLRFRHRVAKEAMVPRLDMVAVEASADLSEAIELSLDSGFSRLPVYGDTLDDVVGVVHVRDLLRARERDEDASLRDLAEEAFVVPESKDVDDLLVELRAQRRRLAVVVDEFGATAGIVTIEDIVEEIIGEVLSETETVPIRWIDDDVAAVRGETNVHAVNEALGTDLPEEGEFETIAGLVMARTGRIAEVGEVVDYDGVRLRVGTVERNRILEVLVDRSGDPTTGTSPGSREGSQKPTAEDEAGSEEPTAEDEAGSEEPTAENEATPEGPPDGRTGGDEEGPELPTDGSEEGSDGPTDEEGSDGPTGEWDPPGDRR